MTSVTLGLVAEHVHIIIMCATRLPHLKLSDSDQLDNKLGNQLYQRFNYGEDSKYVCRYIDI